MRPSIESGGGADLLAGQSCRDCSVGFPSGAKVNDLGEGFQVFELIYVPGLRPRVSLGESFAGALAD